MQESPSVLGDSRVPGLRVLCVSEIESALCQILNTAGDYCRVQGWAAPGVSLCHVDYFKYKLLKR